MKESSAFEAKKQTGPASRLGVENGEEIVITRHGKEVARMIPPRVSANKAEARSAMLEIRAMRIGVCLKGLKIKDLIEEGQQ